MKHKISSLSLLGFCIFFSFCSLLAVSPDHYICEFRYSDADEPFLAINNVQENGHRSVNASYISFIGVSKERVLMMYLEDRETKETLLEGNIRLEDDEQKYFFYNRANQINAVCKKLSH